MHNLCGWPVWMTLVSSLVTGCIDDPPPTEQVEWDEEACAATQPGNACLTFKFTATSDAKADADALIGEMRWALYRSGDVDLFGPGDNAPLYEGVAGTVDFSPDDAVFIDHLADVPAADYHILALLDLNGSKDGEDGEPVTFPSEPFQAPKDVRTQIDVVLDYVL